MSCQEQGHPRVVEIYPDRKMVWCVTCQKWIYIEWTKVPRP